MKIFWYVSPMVEWSFLLVSYGLFMIVTWCWVYQVQVSMASGKMALTKKSAPCREMGLVVTQQKQCFLSIQPKAKWTDKFWVTAVGNPPYPYSGWTLHGLDMWPCSRTRFRVEDCWRKMTASPLEPVVEWCAGGLLHLSGTPATGKHLRQGKRKRWLSSANKVTTLMPWVVKRIKGVWQPPYFIYTLFIYPLLICGLQN